MRIDKLPKNPNFNTSSTFIMLGNYPVQDKKGVKSNINGISTYSFNLISEMYPHVEKEGIGILIFGDKTGSTDFSQPKNNLKILRVWRKNDPLLFLKLFINIKRYYRVSKLFVHFEFNTYGGIFVTGQFPLFLLVLKLTGVSTTVLFHQVVESLNDLSGHLGWEHNSFKSRFYSFFIKKFYWASMLFSAKVIVHDEIFKSRLLSIKKSSNITVIPHGMVDSSEHCKIYDPREKLGIKKSDFIVLSFGFLTWYKGSDWLVDQFAEYYDKTKDASIKLVLAGGESVNLASRHHYHEYYTKMQKKISKYPNIIHTGFVPEDAVSDYYCASNIVVFPYRTHMSASGPFSLALSYDRPFLISKELISVLHTQDIKDSMKSMLMNSTDLVFDMHKKGDLFDKIGQLLSTPSKLENLSNLSIVVKNARNWERTSLKFLKVIYG